MSSSIAPVLKLIHSNEHSYTAYVSFLGHLGITLSIPWLEPATTSEADQKAAETARQFEVSTFIYDLSLLGHLYTSVCPALDFDDLAKTRRARLVVTARRVVATFPQQSLVVARK